LTVRSVEALGATVGQQLSPVRFRPNILIETGDSAPFLEDGWVGAILRIGPLRCRLDKRDKRWVVVNTDPPISRPTPTCFVRSHRTVVRISVCAVRPSNPGRLQSAIASSSNPSGGVNDSPLGRGVPK
jgi:MOSC domain